MKLLEEIRSFHDEPKNFEKITIKGNSFDVAVFANVERYYSMFLRTQIEYFPYVLKGQWREFYGKSRGTGHNTINNLIEMKLIGEGQFKGCHYVYPLTRAMKWHSDNEAAKPFKPKLSNNLLLDNFMRVEYFLRAGTPLEINADKLFDKYIWRKIDYLRKKKEKNDLINKFQSQVNDLNTYFSNLKGHELPIELIEKAKRLTEFEYKLTELQQKIEFTSESKAEQTSLLIPEFAEGGIQALAEEWKDRKLFKDQKPKLESKIDYLRFIQKCLSILPDRNCYIEDIIFFKDSFTLNIAMIHYHDSAKTRYHRLIDDVNMICNCFMDGSFNLKLLCESEKDQKRADKALKEVFRQRKKVNPLIKVKMTNRQNLCKKYVLVNTNIVRYFQKGDTDMLIHEADLSDLEQIIAQLNDEPKPIN
jgi:hypothetical protein